MFGSQYMSQREIQMMLGFGEYGCFMLCQQRCLISGIIEEILGCESIMKLYQCLPSLAHEQETLLNLKVTFQSNLNASVESLQQLLMLMKMSSSLRSEEGKHCIRDTCSTIQGCIDKIEHAYPSSRVDNEPVGLPTLISKEDIKKIMIVQRVLMEARKELMKCVTECESAECVPISVFDSCFREIDMAINSGKSCVLLPPKTDNLDSTTPYDIVNTVSSIVQKSLIAVQCLCKQGTEPTLNGEQEISQQDLELKGTSLFCCHQQTTKEWASIKVGELKRKLINVTQNLRILSKSANIPEHELQSYLLICADACAIVSQVESVCRRRLRDVVAFFRNSSKLNYVLLRIFRVLTAKGFCADDVEEGGEGSGDGNAEGMNFEDDVEGTGMGSGDGKNDVTDQIENEEQLLGLKSDKDEDKDGDKANQDDKQLDEEEANTGMEMEEDFDGEMYDVPKEMEKEQEDDKQEDEEEELDREMGDESSPNEEVVDEKMWDGDEDELDESKEEKFEEDSKVSGEKIEDEMHTKDENENDDENEGATKGKDESTNQEEKNNEEEDNEEKGAEENNDDAIDENQVEEDKINEDAQDDYESNAGIDVRDEKSGEEDEEGNDEMELEDNMNLDGADGEDDAMDNDAEGTTNESEDDEGEGEGDTNEIDNNQTEVTGDEDEDDEAEEEDAALPAGSATTNDLDLPENEDSEEKDGDENEEDTPKLNTSESQENDTEENIHGIAASDATSNANRQEDVHEDEQDDDGDGDGADEMSDGGGNEQEKEDLTGGAIEDDKGDGEWNESENNTGAGKDNEKESKDHPNPFRDPGEAEKFWNRKLNMIEDSADDEVDETDPMNDSNNDDQGNEDMNQEQIENGTFEFSKKNEQSSTQVLGSVAEEDAAQLDVNDKENEENDALDQTEESNTPPKDEEHVNDDKNNREDKSKSERKSETDLTTKREITKDPTTSETPNLENSPTEPDSATPEVDEEADNTKDDSSEASEDIDGNNNRVVTDLNQLSVRDDTASSNRELCEQNDFLQTYKSQLSADEVSAARAKWAELNVETTNLSRRLCEKLRLVLEPLVASKLQGDYRSGKRINMKRVIGYIASGYRKDKIWLRRTKPAKRDYRVLLAVDDSESMKKSGSGEMALAALATIANGMSQLEIGELGIASFGEEMRLLHPFNLPFTLDSGTNLMSHFKFDEQRTRTALCVESAIAALENAAGLSSRGISSSLQLVFIISDGRIERDNRSKLRRLVREMSERNILLVTILVEGNNAKKEDSIIHMKEVSFDAKGRPKVTHFIDDYPFPYYLILEDMASLPEVLGDALRQWFEMLSQIQGSSR